MKIIAETNTSANVSHSVKANSASLKQSTQVTKRLTSMSQKLKTLTIALNQLSKSLAKTSASARSSKKKRQDLFSFDEINRLSSLTTNKGKKKSTASKGRKGSTGGRSTKQTNALLKWLAKLKTALQPVWKLLQRLWALKNDKLVRNFATFQKAVQKLSTQVNKGLKYAYDKVLKPLAKWSMQKAAPALLHALTGAINFLSGALNVVAPLAKSFYEHFLQPVASWAGGVFVGTLETLGDVLNSLGGAFDTIASHINGDGSILQALGGFAEGIADVLDNAVVNGLVAIRDKLSGWVEQHITKPLSGINPILSILLQLVKTPVQLFQEFKEAWANSPAIQAFVELVKKDWKTLSDWISNNPVVVALVQLSHSGWNTVRDWIKTYLGSPVEGLVTLGKSAWTSVHDWVKKHLGSPVEALVSLVKNSWSSVAEWIKSRLGGTVNKAVGLSKNGWNTVRDWVKSHMGAAPSAIVKLQKGWSGSVASKLGLSNLSTTFKIKLPTVSISWVNSLFGIKVPKFNVKWNAKGGILNGAQLFGHAGSTLLGGGEAGREAVLPLDSNTGWMDKIADKVAQKVSNTSTTMQNQSIQVNVTLDGRIVGRSVVQYVNGIAKATGVNPLTAYV